MIASLDFQQLSDLEETMKRIQTHKVVWNRMQLCLRSINDQVQNPNPQGVTGIMIINSDGIAVRTTMDTTTTNAYSAVLSRLSDAARSAIRYLGVSTVYSLLIFSSPLSEIFLMVSIDPLISINRDLDPVNDISFIRMRSMKNEILLAPGKVVTEPLKFHFSIRTYRRGPEPHRHSKP